MAFLVGDDNDHGIADAALRLITEGEGGIFTHCILVSVDTCRIRSEGSGEKSFAAGILCTVRSRVDGIGAFLRDSIDKVDIESVLEVRIWLNLEECLIAFPHYPFIGTVHNVLLNESVSQEYQIRARDPGLDGCHLFVVW